MKLIRFLNAQIAHVPYYINMKIALGKYKYCHLDHHHQQLKKIFIETSGTGFSVFPVIILLKIQISLFLNPLIFRLKIHLTK